MGSMVDARRSSQIRVVAGRNGIVASVPARGPYVAVYASVPAAWVAAGATLQLFGILGGVRASLVGPVVLALGGRVALSVGVAHGLAETYELEVAGAPPIAAGVPVPALLLSVVSFGSGERTADVVASVG